MCQYVLKLSNVWTPQHAVYNSQALQHYYPQLYGPTSPSTPSYQFMGYMPGALGPRAGFSPMQQQAPRPPFIQQPAPQFDGGSFPPGPSLPPDFRLQLPPHALSRQPDETTGAQSAPPVSASAAATPTTDSKEASKTVESNSDLNTSNWLGELKILPKWFNVSPHGAMVVCNRAPSTHFLTEKKHQKNCSFIISYSFPIFTMHFFGESIVWPNWTSRKKICNFP